MHKPPRALHLWEITAVREVFWLALLCLTVWGAYALRGLLAPILIALALAYVADPVVRGLRRRVGAPRIVTALLMLFVLIALVAAFVIWMVPPLVEQSTQLYDKLPVYWEKLQERVELPRFSRTPTAPASPETPPVDAGAVVQTALDRMGYVFGALGMALGTASYLVVVAVVVPILFVYFATYYERVYRLERFLPSSRRPRILELLRRIDAIFSAFIGGQFIVALFTTLGSCVGFYLVDVPYWFVVALVGGVLSIIPYGQSVGWLLAIALKFAETQTGAGSFSWFSVVVTPSLVYAVTQSIESWVVTPLVQREALDLHPLVVIVVVIMGGAVAGIVGVMLAVPVAASAKMLFHELAAPRLEHWADTH